MQPFQRDIRQRILDITPRNMVWYFELDKRQPLLEVVLDL